MYNEESLMHFLELQKQYEKRFVGKKKNQLYPRIWYEIEDYDVLSKILEEALSKNEVLTKLDSIYELEIKNLDKRFNDTLEEGIKKLEEKYFK